MYEKIESLKLKSSVSAFNYGLIYHYDKENDLHMIGCLDVDMINITKYKIVLKDAVEQVKQVECSLAKVDPIDESIQFCLLEFHSFKFMNFDLFCLISSSGLHVTKIYFIV